MGTAGWVCFKCHAPNEMSSRYCQVCNAVRPPGAEALNDEGEDLPMDGLGLGPEYLQTQSSMLAGLAASIRDVASGRISAREFRGRMSAAGEGVDEIFGAIGYELSNGEGGNSDYSLVVQNALEDARLLFRLALSQLEAYRGRRDNATLRMGMILAEKAEECYQSVRRGVDADASGHNLRGRADVVRRLAARLMEGSMSREEYREEIEAVEKAVQSWLDDGMEQLNAGLAAAKVFDGSQYSAIQKVGEMLEDATDSFAQVILAIHTADSVLSVANEIKGELGSANAPEAESGSAGDDEDEASATDEVATDLAASGEAVSSDDSGEAAVDATIDIAAFMEELNASASDYLGQMKSQLENLEETAEGDDSGDDGPLDGELSSRVACEAGADLGAVEGNTGEASGILDAECSGTPGDTANAATSGGGVDAAGALPGSDTAVADESRVDPSVDPLTAALTQGEVEED